MKIWKERGKLIQILLGLILAVVGVSFAYFGERPKVAQAESDYSYSADWRATHLLVLMREYRYLQNDEIAIGPAQWQVKGSFPQGIVRVYYKEIWESPNSKPNFQTIIPGGDRDGVRVVNYLPDQWLVGFYAPYNFGQRFNYILRKKSISQSIQANQYVTKERGVTINLGKTISCFGGFGEDRERGGCMFATGAYSFFDFWALGPDFGGTNEKLRAMGLAVPLKWQVSGYVCREANDPDCQ